MPKTEELTPLQELQAEGLTLSTQLDELMQKATQAVADPDALISLAEKVSQTRDAIQRNERHVFAETVRENAAARGNAAENATVLFDATIAEPTPENKFTHKVVYTVWMDEGDDEASWDVEVVNRKTTLPAQKAPTPAKGVQAFGHTFYPKRKIHLVIEDETDYVTKLRHHLPDEYANETDFETLILAFENNDVKIEPAK